MTSSPVTVLITSGPVMNICEVWSTMIDEVGERRGVDVPAGAAPMIKRDLRDDSGGVRVAAEDLAIQAERDHAFLDAGAAALVDDR